VEPEPEVDLSSFLARQRLADPEDGILATKQPEDDGDVDHTLSGILAGSSTKVKPRKNNVQTIDWDASLDELKREKESAEAVWGMVGLSFISFPRLIVL